ncbi:MAG: hypothetical protein ACREQA_13320 [Candidatus Binatia bacterium]
MVKTSISLIVFLPYLLVARLSWGSGPNEVPDFSDEKNWAFVEQRPFFNSTPWGEYEIGTIKKYRRINQPHVVGFEEFLVGSEKSFWKRWGFELSPFTYHALRKKGSEEWFVGSPGSYWESAGVFDGMVLKGMWFVLYIPSREEAFGRYFPTSNYRFKAVTPPKKGEAT